MRFAGLLLFLWVFHFSPLVAQSYRGIDRHARKAPVSLNQNLKKLTQYLAEPYDSDLKKVRSFYSWIIHRIEYDKSANKKGIRRINRSNQDILRRGKAICLGYANLFREMCTLQQIPCEVIVGYPKQNGQADLSSADHAWSAVLIAGQWYLLDLTWAKANKKQNKEDFLSSPEAFIQSHLPLQPMWQLLPCPLPRAVFQKEAIYIESYLNSQDSCYNYLDSIRQWRSLPLADQKLQAALEAYEYHPVEENKQELGHAYMDYVFDLENRAAILAQTDSLTTLMELQLEIIHYVEKAQQYTQLYPNQLENLAYTHLNHAVALSRQFSAVQEEESLLTNMEEHLLKAQQILEELPGNVLLDNALLQIEEYAQWVQTKLGKE